MGFSINDALKWSLHTVTYSFCCFAFVIYFASLFGDGLPLFSYPGIWNIDCVLNLICLVLERLSKYASTIMRIIAWVTKIRMDWNNNTYKHNVAFRSQNHFTMSRFKMVWMCFFLILLLLLLFWYSPTTKSLPRWNLIQLFEMKIFENFSRFHSATCFKYIHLCAYSLDKRNTKYIK